MAHVSRKLHNYPLRKRLHTENAKLVSFHLETRYKDAISGNEEEKDTTDLDQTEKNETLRKFLPRIRHNDSSYNCGVLAGERFTAEDICKISTALSYNTTLVILSLSSIALDDAGVVLICSALQSNNVLQELKLDSNMITDAGVDCLADELLRENYCENNRNEAAAGADSHKNNIELLSMQYNGVTDKGATVFASALPTNSVLQTLLLGGNPIGFEGVVSFSTALRLNGTLTALNLTGISGISKPPSSSGTDTSQYQNTNMALLLHEYLLGLQKLLDLPMHERVHDHNIIPLVIEKQDEEEAEHDSTASANPHVRRVLAAVLADDPSMTKAKLHGQGLTDRDMAQLSRALQQNHCVTSLSLGGNSIGDAGAAALALALRYNSSISSIWLGNNRIGDVGATELAKALDGNHTLQTLSLHNNRVGAVGAQHFLRLMQDPTSRPLLLESLNLYGNKGIGSEILASLRELEEVRVEGEQAPPAAGISTPKSRILRAKEHDTVLRQQESEAPQPELHLKESRSEPDMNSKSKPKTVNQKIKVGIGTFIDPAVSLR